MKMPRALKNFTRAHAVIFVVVWAIFGGLAFVVTYGNTSTRQNGRVTITTAPPTILGPQAGAVCRQYDRSTVRASLALLPYCLAPLVVAIATQFVPLPPRRWAVAVRLSSGSSGCSCGSRAVPSRL